MSADPRNQEWRTDPLIRAVIGLSAMLAVLTLGGLLVFGRGDPIVRLPWFAPTMEAFDILAAFTVAWLCLGRFRALGRPWTFWAGLTFLANGTLGTFYLLAWPDLLDGQGVIARLPNTASWLRLLDLSSLTLLLAGAIARQPARLQRWLAVSAYAVVAILAAAAGLLSVRLEAALPIAVVSGMFTPLSLAWQTALVILGAAGAFLLVRRYLAEGDRFLAYLALFLVFVTFAMLCAIVGGQRYTLWWYGARFLYIPAYLVVLFGLLREGYTLYGIEHTSPPWLCGPPGFKPTPWFQCAPGRASSACSAPGAPRPSRSPTRMSSSSRPLPTRSP